MARRDPLVALRQMRDHASKALRLVQGKSPDDVEGDEVLFLALIRLLEVVGEAASRVPEDLRKRYPEIPWRDVVGLRNVLIHGYDSVDEEIVWQVLVGDLPPLVKSLDRALESEKG